MVEPRIVCPEEWIKAPSGLITPHFSWEELACRHCGRVPALDIVQNTARWAERIRREVYEDRPMHVTSGCRCETHNRRVGGASQSYHVKGWAIDYVVRGLSPYEAWRLARAKQGKGKLIGGLGRYPKGGWVHADRGPSRRWIGP